MCQTLSQAYSRWRCTDPYFCFRSKIWGYNILHLCDCSRSLGTSFELLTATITPRVLLLRYLDLPVENALRGWKLGQNREGVIGFWPQRKLSYFSGPWLLCKILWKSPPTSYLSVPSPSTSPPRSCPLKAALGSGERCKFPQQGPGRSAGHSRILLHCMFTKRIWSQHFWFFGQHCNEWQNESWFIRHLGSKMTPP